MLLRFLWSCVALIALSWPAEAADVFRATAAKYRTAASACPQDQGCNHARAVYYDCLATQLGRTSTRCLPPSCKASQCPQAPEPSPPPPPAVPAMTAPGGPLVSLLQASETARNTRQRTDLAQARQLWELERQRAANASSHLARVNQDLSSMASEVHQTLADESQASNVARTKLIATRAAHQTSTLVWPDEQLVDGPSPADKKAKCGPWLAMKDPNGFVYPELDLAICGDGAAPGGELRDLPMSWMVRNRSRHTVTIRYQLGIQCITACTSGWYDQQATLAPGKKVTGNVRQAWRLSGHRVLDAAVKP